MKFKKNSAKEVFQDQFGNELRINLNKNIGKYDSFEKIFIKVLDKYAPTKRKFLRANNAP